METYSLEVKKVSKSFKEGIAMEDISFQAENGSIIGFVGHNGSGKSVLFKCICGFYAVTEGEITINGRVVGIGEQMPRNIAFIIEEPAFWESIADERIWSFYMNYGIKGIRNISGR